MSSIASQFGFFWQTLWNLPENADLKNKRKNPNILMEGDRIVIPPIRVKQESRGTDGCHNFKRLGASSNFRMCLLSDGEPRVSVDYTCDIDGHLVNGQTDSDGVLNIPIPPGARSGMLRLLGGKVVEEYRLNFGELDPIDEVSGVQQRLNNLGYDCAITGELDEQTKDAMSSFRAEKNLPESDAIDDDLRGALVDAHGS
jgi:hypothetical protein